MSNNAQEFLGAELEKIADKGIRDFTEYVLNNAPTYFWLVPSSSTGKFHPEQSNGQSGLIRHIRATVYFAEDRLCRAYNIEGIDKDIIVSAVLLHDLLKYSQPMQKFTTKFHDKESADFVYNLYKQGGAAAEGVSKETVGAICKAVAFHMGRWTTEARAKKFPDEYSAAEIVVHLADMMSASKEVSLGFLQESLIG